MAWHPSGDYALFTLLRTKNLVPMTRINHGWTISNGLGILWRDGTVDQVLLDQNHLCFPDPTDVVHHAGRQATPSSPAAAPTAWRWWIWPSSSPCSRPPRPHERQRVIPNHTGKPAEYRRQAHPHADRPARHHLLGGRHDRLRGQHAG